LKNAHMLRCAANRTAQRMQIYASRFGFLRALPLNVFEQPLKCSTCHSGAGGCVATAVCHCETPLRRCGNLIFSRVYEIASLIIFARKDIATQSRRPESRKIFFTKK